MRRLPALLALASIFLTALLTVSCTASRPASASTQAQTLPVDTVPALFQVPKNQLPQLKIVDVKRETWTSVIRTTGTVDWDADHTTQAITQVSGPIARILVDTGSRVAAGGPLLYVSSPDVANAISAYKKARNREQLAGRVVGRTRELLDHGAAAQKDLESAQADLNDAGTDVQNSLQALRIFGVTKQEIDQAERQSVAISPELGMYAPIAGVVVQKLVLPGQLIQAGATICFALSD